MSLCQKLCPKMQNLSTIQDRQKPDKTSIHASRGGKINSTICKLFYGLDNWPTTSGWVRFHPHCGRQREHKGGNSYPNNKDSDARRSRTTFFGQFIQTIWFTGWNVIGQRTSICCHGFRELLKLLGIKLNLMMAYYPQTDGVTERVNQEIKAYLSIYCSAHPMEWKNSLPTREFTHNNWWHADWTHSSFELMHGKAPLAIPTSFENTKFPSVAEKIKNLVTSHEEALAAHELARSQMLRTLFLLWYMLAIPFSSLFYLRSTGIYHKANMPFTSFLPYVLHVFTSRLTPSFYLFKPVVRQLYSLAFH